jgi:hypothetical protein
MFDFLRQRHHGPLNVQATNPVSNFATDNNGVIVQLPAVPAGGMTSTTAGPLVFGIGPQNNNGLGTAAVYITDPTHNTFSAQYKGTTYSYVFIESGSNALYLDDTSITQCSGRSSFFCPAAALSLSAVVQGLNGASAALGLQIGNADALYGSRANAMSDYVPPGRIQRLSKFPEPVKPEQPLMRCPFG